MKDGTKRNSNFTKSLKASRSLTMFLSTKGTENSVNNALTWLQIGESSSVNTSITLVSKLN